MLGQAGHGHDRAADDDDEARACRQAHFAHVEREIFRRAEQAGVVAERILRLGDADRQLAIAHRLELVEHLFGRGGVADAAGMVNFLRHGFDLVGKRRVEAVGELDRRHGGFGFDHAEHRPGQRLAALTAFGEHFG